MAPVILFTLLGTYFLLNLAVLAVLVFRGLQDAGFYSSFRDNLGFLGVLVSIPLTIAIMLFLSWVALFFIIYLGPLWLILIFVLFEAYRKYRASRQYALLWLLAVSAEREVPLTAALEAFARERSGGFARKARRLAALLETGRWLPTGLEQVHGLLPSQSQPLIRVGCQSGALAPALRRAAEVNDRQGALWSSLTGKIAYLVLLLVFGMLILTFVMMWIVPKYQKIFLDFDSTLPHYTQLLLSFSHFLVNYWFLFTPLLTILMLIPLFPLARYFGWDTPGMGWLTRRLDAADVLDGLALVARQQRPMLDGLDALALSHPRWYIRTMLSRAAGDARNGLDWAESLCARGLIRRADLAVLQSAERAGNLPWALRELADGNRRRFAYRLQAVIQTAFPVIIIFYGAIVGFIVVALFLPLIKLITALAS